MTEGSRTAPDTPERNLALELVRVTEAAALAAARWVGRGDKDGADAVAVDAMRKVIATVQMRGVVVIGEGEKDNAPSVLAVAPRGSMYDPSAVFYMEKLVTGPEAAAAVDIRAPVAENIHAVAKAKGSRPEDVTVVMLDRPRHER